MKNFVSVTRLATRSKARCALLVCCSLGIGVLWGANIGILYPFLEALFYGETVPESFQRKITEGLHSIEDRQQELQQIRLKAANEGIPLPREAELLTSRIEQQQVQIRRYRAWLPVMTRLLPATPYGTIVLIASLLVAAALLRAALMAINDILVTQLTQRTLVELRSRTYRHLLTLDLDYFTEDRSPKVLTRFTHDMQRVGDGVTAVLQQSLREPFKMLACLAGAAFISWQLLLFSLILIPPGALVLRWLQRFNRRVNEDSLAAMSDLYSVLTETLQGIRVVRSSATEGFERRRFHGVLRTIRARIEHAALVRSIVKPAIELLGVSVVVLAILAGGWLVLQQRATLWGFALNHTPQSPASLLIFFGMILGATDPLRKMAGLTVTVNRSSAATDRVFQILEKKPRILSPPDGVSLPKHRPPCIEFRDLSYKYRGRDQRVLNQVSLRIDSGECIALIGANGSGKTTLLHLLLRFFDPTSGSVEIDGVSLKQVNLKRFRRNLGFIPQHPFLFDDTVENNIRYGQPWSTSALEQVREAACRAGAAAFIEDELPDGYGTEAGEAGNQLSGGQIQKISLARAILRNPGLLLLDEATSQLDPLAEAHLVQQLKPFLKGRTALMVTHRPALLELADRIVLLDHGEIIETGTHPQLLASSRLYREMLQTGTARAA